MDMAQAGFPSQSLGRGGLYSKAGVLFKSWSKGLWPNNKGRGDEMITRRGLSVWSKGLWPNNKGRRDEMITRRGLSVKYTMG